MACRVVSKVSAVGEAAVVPGSPCLPDEALGSGWSWRSRIVFPGRLGVVSGLAGFGKGASW